jgi:Outer membrane protein beta-barrel family/CarboxypepD_reg-like domain
MKKIIILSFLAMICSIVCEAQGHLFKGFITDDSANALLLKGAVATLTSSTNTSQVITVQTDSKGQFIMNAVPDGTYVLDLSYVGYDDAYKTVVMSGQDIDAGKIGMHRKGVELTDIVVISKVPPVQQKNDTIQYNASQYKTNPDATAQDLIQKMPGISVDNTGTVTAHGDQVKSVTVDGKKFFGDDATAALQNLPADVIDKIQVFDKLSDQAQFTGFDDGNSVRAINIVTKASMRTGQFGRVFGGYGTDGRYLMGGNINFFKGARRISVVGLFNNVNQQNFSSQDILGFSSTSGGGGRGGRSSGVPTVGPQNGITATNAIGLNYDDMWGKKLEMQGSYFFNNGNVHDNETSNTEYFLPDSTNQFYKQQSTSENRSYNHRINLRFDYKIDSANLITITPILSFQNNNAISNLVGTSLAENTDSVNNTISNTRATGSGYNLNNTILYRHAFKKKGRTISLNLNGTFTKNNGDTYLQSFNRYYTTSGVDSLNDSVQQYTAKRTNGYQLSANVAYTEPIGKKAQLQLNYSPSYSSNKANTGTYQFDNITNAYSEFDTSLSNNFNNTVTSQTTGITFRMGNINNFIAVGASYQYTELNSNELFPADTILNRSFNDVLPNFMWRTKLSAKANLRIFYRASLTAPAVTQLQNVINNSNPLFITTGNPVLKQEYGNTLAARYTFTNTEKGNSFFANIYLQQYNNYIGNSSFIATKDSALNSTVTLFKGSQLTAPINVDGYVSMRSFLTYGLPVSLIKSTVNLNAGFTWARTPSVINNVSNLSNNYGYNTGVVVASNISQYIDFTLSYNATFNVVDNSIEPQLNSNYFAQTADIKFNLLSKKGWFINNDLSNQSYEGLANGFNQSYWLWNLAVGKKFLTAQRGELKLSGFDLLNQNRSITRTVTESSIEDDQNLVLTQYFMLSFTYTLKSFGNVPSAKPGGGPGMYGGGRPGGFGGPAGPGGPSF